MNDLLSILEQHTTLDRVASTRGGEYAGPCPACGGTDRFRVWPYDTKPRYWCRRCGRHGDTADALQEFDGLNKRDALSIAGVIGPRSGATSFFPFARQQQRQFIANAQQNAESLRRLIDDLLAVAQLDEGMDILRRPLSVPDELDRLVVHGILHLLGYDDHGQQEREQMWSRQEAILEAIHTAKA